MNYKYIKTIPMCGGYGKAFHIQLERNAHIIDHFYFCTSEGISTHRSEEHMIECLTKKGFAGFLDIQDKAIPVAKLICGIEGLPSKDVHYLVAKMQLWTLKENQYEIVEPENIVEDMVDEITSAGYTVKFTHSRTLLPIMEITW